MDDGLKQRLVGAVVVCAVAVILLPSLFQRSERRVVDRTSIIPVAPVVDPIIPVEPARPAAMQILQEPETVFMPDPEADLSIEGDEPSGLDSTGLPKAWVLQVASFSELERAKDLVDRLAGMGYKAYMTTSAGQKATHYRVNVGPQINKADALKVKKDVDKALNVSALVLNYHP